VTGQIFEDPLSLKIIGIIEGHFCCFSFVGALRDCIHYFVVRSIVNMLTALIDLSIKKRCILTTNKYLNVNHTTK
jgi:hypothetical protein